MTNGQVDTNIMTNTVDVIGNNAMVDPFGSNAAAALAYKKVERLMTATHMVTNHVPKSESLRQRVRDISSELLTDTIKLRDGFTSLGSGTLGSITAQVRLLLSLLDALYASGLISEMNLRVLKDAYRDFIQSLTAMAEGSASDGVELTQEYFVPRANTTVEVLKHTSKSVTKHRKTKNKKLNTKLIKKQALIQVPTQAPSKVRQSSSASSERLESIIEFITKRGEASVGELAQVITACSSKTLQRDVNKLVAINRLNKTGQKRWTKYSLASAL